MLKLHEFKRSFRQRRLHPLQR